MTPNEIQAKIQEIRDAIAPDQQRLERLEEKLAPDLQRIEELKAEKATVINAYGEKLRTIRRLAKLPEGEFIAFRQSVYAEPDEDVRMSMIDAKLAELQ